MAVNTIPLCNIRLQCLRNLRCSAMDIPTLLRRNKLMLSCPALHSRAMCSGRDIANILTSCSVKLSSPTYCKAR
eukprot:443838-Hanusia_phi.AAC.1